MTLKKTHFVVAALIVGCAYALVATALPRDAITVEVYTDGDKVIGEKVVYDPCETGMTSWGVFTGAGSRTTVPCGNRVGKSD